MAEPSARQLPALFDQAFALWRAGDAEGARSAYQQALDSLAGQLQADSDVAGLRGLHAAADRMGNLPDPVALVDIGRLLENRGDTDSARLAYQQAIDMGYRWADDLIEKLHPTPPPTDAELDELLPQFDPRNIIRTGTEVLSGGLPELPERLSYLMAIPVAYWTAQHCAVVQVLRFTPNGRQHRSTVWNMTYARTETGWTAHRHFVGTGFYDDPVARPGSRRGLDGRYLVISGGSDARETTPGNPAMIQHGRAAPAVVSLALIQDGRRDVRPLESHFGAWVICTDRPGPIQLEGRDAADHVLASISFQPYSPDDR